VLTHGEKPVDDCQWQIDFLVEVTAIRDRLASGGAPPDVPAVRYYGRMADAIDEVEKLRSSRDPILSGPVPADTDARRAWLAARYELIHPVERSLDALGELLRGGHAPSLENSTWLPRLTACLMACERYFDERVRLGSDGTAPGGEVAHAEWPRIQAAAAVLRSFGPYLKAADAKSR
jgi:hypothetical protein